MKEIKTLIQQLRSYPSNFFVFPSKHKTTKTGSEPIEHRVVHTITGLTVCNHLGEERGFIETGGEEGVVIN